MLPPVEPESPVTAPNFDAESFARWLTAWRASEGLTWGAIAERSELHKGTLQQLVAGPSATRTAQGQKKISPAAETIARLAYGLDLELSYVASKAGLTNTGSRWRNFNREERAALSEALRTIELAGAMALRPPPVILRRLLEELEESHD